MIPFFEVFIIEKDSLNNFKSFFHLQFSLYFQKLKNFCGRFSNTIFFNPNVVAGSSGIMILAPIKSKMEVDEPKYDANHHPVLNSDGTQATEKVTKEYKSFRPCYVFDLSQTEGEPLPTLANRLEDKVDDFVKLKEALFAISPVPITFEEIPGEANGFFSPSEMRIAVQKDMPELQTIKTMLHEIAHATYGHGSKDDKSDRQSREIISESTAFWVAGMLGLDTSDYSFGYISGWSKDKEVSELKENLELIKNTANELANRIDEQLEKMNLAMAKEKQAEPVQQSEDYAEQAAVTRKHSR